MADKAEIEGLKELRAKLKALPNKIQKNILRSAIHAAAGELRDEAKAMAPVQSGALRKSIKAIRKRGTPTEVQSNVNVGAFYSRFVEQGHALVKGGRKNAKKKKAGAIIGHVPAKPFLRPAYDKMKGKLSDFVKKKIIEKLFSLASKA